MLKIDCFHSIIKLFPVIFCAGAVLLTGCHSDIGIEQTSSEARSLYNIANLTTGGLAGNSINILSNYQLNDVYENDPEQLINTLEQLYQQHGDPELVAALADTALQIGFRLAGNPDQSSRYFLAAAFYSCGYLKLLDNTNDLYDEQRIRIMRIYNLASTELFIYLKNRNLERRCGYELSFPGNKRKVYFKAPRFDIPLPEKSVADFSPCANYIPLNLTHDSKNFGLGVPMIATLQKDCCDLLGYPLPGFPIAVTMVMDFTFNTAPSRADAELKYIYSRTAEKVKLGERTLPLAVDFSTPLAKAASQPQKHNFLERTFLAREANDFTGLFLFEPFDDKRIPVVFVHGLMSDIRTWGQMLNTLLNDKQLRHKYQFMGFAYSSGNPIFLSASQLRSELQILRNKLVEKNLSTRAFDNMVLVGHSMGGLLCRLQISSSDEKKVAEVLDIGPEIKKQFTTQEWQNTGKSINFLPSPSVKRVIFIAVPHRGSEIARSWVGSLGASLIKLPVGLIRRNILIMQYLIKNGKLKFTGFGNNTGIDNLRPDAPMLHLLNALEIAPIPYHSIIGNKDKAHTPGGTDGIVPYWSSHLDQAASELIVRSGHSAHRAPLAIQEVRRILLKHAVGKQK
ncbi:MAG: hypothetical protein IKA65_08965 [Lentisphaeria bacterium]|nr:hypothetical protein [Lentisphaeria bacterium]